MLCCVSGDEAAWVSQFSLPAVVIDRPRAEDVVVLQRVAGGRLGIVDRVGQRRSFNRLLLDAANLFGGLDADQIERRRKKVDDMAVLGANSAFVLDAFRPIDDERIVRAAFAVRILLPVLERRVGGLRPAQRIVSLGGSGRTDLANLVQVIVDIFLLR